MKISQISFIAALLLSFSASAMDDSVTIKGVKQISLDEIGVLNSNNGGLPSDIWVGSDKVFITKLLATMPVQMKSEVSKNLRQKLLLSTAIPPEGGEDDAPSLMLTRLQILALIGDAKSLGETIKLIPEHRITQQIRQVHMASLFVAQSYNDACELAVNIVENSDDFFWRKALIICKAFEGKESEVEFGIKLLKEDGHVVGDGFKNMARDILKEKDNGKNKWLEVIKARFLQLPQLEEVLLNLNRINNSPFDRSKTINWLKENKELKAQEKLDATAGFYEIINAVTDEVLESELRSLLLSSIAKNITPPASAIVELLNRAVVQNKKGEVVLFLIHALHGREAHKLPHNVLVKSVKSLKAIGLDEEARGLADEGFFKPQ